MAGTFKYATFTSDIELPFYTSLASHKINHDKLDDSARRVLGLYELNPKDSDNASCRMQLHANALTGDEVPAGFYRAEGMIKNVNTIEDYRALDKSAILNQAGRTIWAAIDDGTIYSCPSLLASFTIVCFADLKKYKFTYLFGFPALHFDLPWTLDPQYHFTGSSTQSGLWDGFGIPLKGDETTALVDSVQTWRYGVDARQYGFFLAKKARATSTNGSWDSDAERLRPVTPGTPGIDIGFTWMIGSLGQYEEGFFDGARPEDCLVCFADPSNYSVHPGWMLRNLLMLVRHRWKLAQIQILCYRDIQSQRHEARSFIIHLRTSAAGLSTGFEKLGISSATAQRLKVPKITGWERNKDAKVVSKVANLGEYMDPQRLADQAVDLNLKLIKWRIAPGLDLEKIKETKCLLLGAGTLGTYVARNLLGWGVRMITFVDNGNVSFSNPVRQPLFDFKDCLAGGAKKAVRAAEALTEIYPGVNSAGHTLMVPMAGHPVMDENAVKAEFDVLEKLIDDHDAIFLLMDTRESRWLPTLVGKAKGKIVLNAALGFDTFVVMRHGWKDPGKPSEGTELGCYFCNDVVAPTDSLTDRTLDQQCTVTRPGIAAIASALLVEIFVSVLQHPLGPLAPSPSHDERDTGDHPLGIVPHQIRGFLSTFQNMVISGKSYDSCSACSDKVTARYISEGWEFVKRALNEKGYVEEVSGLAEVQRAAEIAAADVEWDDEVEAEEEGEGEMV
ncbi:Autophagy protein 7 [Xylographa opegraphella]|nr:Autophagy protein 7 [Xylographa opegraphella]